ncbi:MAG TPA: DUF6328 family protein [Pseudolysinimonas sp.]|nr:DUF6328 family protein [Pseudolysinimonas sp.]
MDRDETESERLDRNWNELLQELRVTQTGTQIFTGFLLTIPFQQRFSDLTAPQLSIYLVLVGFSTLATILAIAPVSLHRALFRQGAKTRIVHIANLLLIGALAAVALTLTGTALLIFDVVLGHPAGMAAGIVTLIVTGLIWLALPAVTRRSHR